MCPVKYDTYVCWGLGKMLVWAGVQGCDESVLVTTYRVGRQSTSRVAEIMVDISFIGRITPTLVIVDQ